mmetsp:Transcript_15358/g.27296  ORF Transcript_15358/g.27296 Transcript_15358/m.27296 type:complete len:517 (+) Transcript_15358:198-1748(+)
MLSQRLGGAVGKVVRSVQVRAMSSAGDGHGEAAQRLSLSTINENLKTMEYAVRGEVPQAAAAMDKKLRAGGDHGLPFDQILYCNIGNPQSVGQKPITYYREMMALVTNPSLLDESKREVAKQLYSESELDRAVEIINMIGTGGTGAYSESMGVRGFREDVCRFIENRDGYPANPDQILLSNGASTAIQMLLTALIADEKDTVMVPIPQYPIYSALITLLGGRQGNYYLDEDNGWAFREEELERAMDESISKGGNPKAIVVINPGNPTGNTMSYEDIATVIRFCHKHQLVLLADEVYQENIYDKERRPFISCKKVLMDLGLPIELASFHSTSKGYAGECGRRGGYMEAVNFKPEVMEQIVKLASSGLCSNLMGQVMCDLMVSPPKSDDETQKLFEKERDEVLSSLGKKAHMVHARLNELPGIVCQPLEGAMYAFPRLELPEYFVEKARKAGKTPDSLYALSLLEHTGICTVPGSGFGQIEGTYHIRMTFLPGTEALTQAMDRFAEHHMMIMENKADN